MEQANRLSRLLRSAIFVFGLLLIVTNRLYAQVDTGSVAGTVKDQTGAVVPNAKVTLTNEDTNYSIFTTTGADGSYIFTPVKIGNYSVAAEYTGFRKATHPHITVNVQQQVTADFSLQPGAVTQTVEVTAEVPLLQTANASVGQVVNSRAVNDLPLNGRNFTFLAQLTAGVSVGQPDNRGLQASGSFTANGARPAQNNYLLDGIDNNIDVVDFLNGTAFVVLPPVDAVHEFKVQTNNYAAEIGRAGGAVLNATIKSGANALHGDAWEFFRNDKLDSADFFQNAAGQSKGKFRQNQFGFTGGGPVYIPRLYNGRNRTFFFGDYEGTRIRQATPFTGVTVPTVAERQSGYTNLSDLITGQSGAKLTDALGRTFPQGTIFDPATTRAVTAGRPDPGTTGLTAVSTGFVRDPFYQGSLNGVTDFRNVSVNLLNQLPSSRLDKNAISLLNLFPQPTSGGLLTNFASSPVKRDNANRFDIRVDENFGEHDTMFARISYHDEPQFIPGPFGGIADGGAFNQGDQIATSRNAALSYTHSFSPSTINEARLGFSGIHTGRLQANGNTMGIPDQFGIKGIPQVPQNGGLPAITFSGLNTLGSNAFLVSDEFNSTVQVTENLTKIYSSHTFKGGVEFQHIKFSTLQPPWARGQFQFDGAYTDMPNICPTFTDPCPGNTGRAQLLLIPQTSPFLPQNGKIGGADRILASNIANTDNGHNYYAAYFQDDWKIRPKLTLNLGVRWDHFGYVEENFGAQANFIPGTPGSGAQYLIPIERQNDPLSSGVNPGFIGFTDALKKDGINLVYSDNFALGTAQKTNFSPRVGFAYQATPKLVVRGGYGIFYGGFENRGYSPNIGENYPFQFSFNFLRADDTTPLTPDNSVGLIENGLSNIPLDPRLVNSNGSLQLRGIQFNYITPYTQAYNAMVQYQLTPDESVEAGYVGSLGRHIEVFPGSNRVAVLLPPGTKRAPLYLPFPDFSENASFAATEGSSYYHSLQVKFERRFSAGLNFLAAYTYSKVVSDARDLLNGGGDRGYRAPYIPGVGVHYDYQIANFDIRNVFHFSGGYELPVGRGKRFMSDASGITNRLLSGWSTNWVLTLQDGQPITIPCKTSTQSGAGCYALLVPGQDRLGGLHNVNQWMNPAAFHDPPAVAAIGQTDLGPLGGKGSQIAGPGFHRLDFSVFKQFKTSERTHLEFRTEVFNITNHPNFLNPGFGGNGIVAAPGATDFTNANFGKITATRDNPNDPREIQFALKFYW